MLSHSSRIPSLTGLCNQLSGSRGFSGGKRSELDAAIDDAFPGSRLHIDFQAGGRFAVELRQEGLLRPLSAAELSDGTLRYLLLVAALLTPRPPSLMVLNEPETSLHPDLLPALGRLIIAASKQTQVWVVSHASRLIATLKESPDCNTLELDPIHLEDVVQDFLWEQGEPMRTIAG